MKLAKIIKTSAAAAALLLGASVAQAEHRDFSDAAPAQLENGSYECHCDCVTSNGTTSFAEIPGECKDNTEGGQCQWQGEVGGIKVTYKGNLEQCSNVFVLN